MLYFTWNGGYSLRQVYSEQLWVLRPGDVVMANRGFLWKNL